MEGWLHHKVSLSNHLHSLIKYIYTDVSGLFTDYQRKREVTSAYENYVSHVL